METGETGETEVWDVEVAAVGRMWRKGQLSPLLQHPRLKKAHSLCMGCGWGA